MIDVQNGLGIKNISDLARKEIFEKYCDEEQLIKDLTKEQIRKFKRSEAELDKKNVYASNITRYARSDIMGKIIKNCRGVKRCNDGISKMEKANHRHNFKMLLGFKKMIHFKRKNCQFYQKFKQYFHLKI